MKVYSCPTECPAPEPDYSNYDTDKELAREDKHQEDLKAYLIKRGYRGKYTGEIIRFGVADGYASYMMADAPTTANSYLIHLPYGDAYQYRDVKFLPKKEIVKRIEQEKAFSKLFSKKD